MFFYLPSCTSALSVCLFVCIVYVFKKRNQRVCPTQHLVVYIIKINESVSDCLAPGPRKRENWSGGAGHPPPPPLQTELIHFIFPPSHKKFLHFYISTSKKFMVEMFFFRQNLLPWEGSDQMSAFWSMFWCTPFRNFSRKNTIFRKFRPVVEILSVSDGRPWSQGVCPSLTGRKKSWTT